LNKYYLEANWDKMNFIAAQDRFQMTLSSLEDKIIDDNPVRFIDALVEHLDLIKL